MNLLKHSTMLHFEPPFEYIRVRINQVEASLPKYQSKKMFPHQRIKKQPVCMRQFSTLSGLTSLMELIQAIWVQVDPENELIFPYMFYINMANYIVILIWNCRGSARDDFRVELKDLIATHKPNIKYSLKQEQGEKQQIGICPILAIQIQPEWTRKAYLVEYM